MDDETLDTLITNLSRIQLPIPRDKTNQKRAELH